MRQEIREDVEPLAISLFEKGWRSDERDAIREEFSLTKTEAAAVAEIIKELEEKTNV